MASRVIGFVNRLLVVLFLAVLGLGWWVFVRTRPAPSGTLSAPVEGDVRIVRDQLGVPHITARTVEDAYFGQGFVTAQDRMWQMDISRRLGGGELSEILGQTMIETDSRHRKLRLRKIARAAARQMRPEDRKLLAAYSRGVNFYLESSRGKWGPEFMALRYEPRPWLVEDTILCGLVMDLTLTGTADDELRKLAALAATKEKALVERLFPLRTSAEFRPGSNAWVISGARTTTGKPLLANDMHLGWAMPDTWYLAHLQALGMNVTGFSLPGFPGVVVGHNERIAWGVTNLQTDSQDLYAERMDLRNGIYEYKGQRRPAVREVEWMAVKGARPVQLLNLITVHGPVHSTSNGVVYSIQWTAAARDNYRFPFLDLNRAGNWQQFRESLSGWTGPALNFVYADVEGNIGYQAAGPVPKRGGRSGDVPADGASGEGEWQGFIPFEELPTAFNPPSGILVTANQNPFPESAGVSGYFAARHRAKQIRDRLLTRQKWDVETTLRLQTDVYSGYLRYVAGEAAAAVARKGAAASADARDAAAMLKGWDGQMRTDSAVAYVAWLTDQSIRRALIDRAAPKSGIAYREMSAAEVVEDLIRERPKEWFADWDAVLATALGEAYDEARRTQGRNREKWSWGRANEFTLRHPVAGQASWIAPYFNLGPVQLPGSGSTVRQTSRSFSPSQRFVADLSNWEKSVMNLRIGQSAHRLSGHYKDQWEAYLAGRSFPVQFGAVEPKETLLLRPR